MATATMTTGKRRVSSGSECDMGVREGLTRRPWIAAAVLAAGVGVVMWTLPLRGTSPAQPTMPSRLYFSDDDGKTFFADDAALIPPFEHNGHTASMAMVFRCTGKQSFVGYLIRYNREGKAALEALPESQRRSTDAKVLGIKQSTAEVKRPGDTKWLPMVGDAATGQILRPHCPNGDSSDPEPVMP
jgi:hypothetical protein